MDNIDPKRVMVDNTEGVEGDIALLLPLNVDNISEAEQKKTVDDFIKGLDLNDPSSEQQSGSSRCKKAKEIKEPKNDPEKPRAPSEISENLDHVEEVLVDSKKGGAKSYSIDYNKYYKYYKKMYNACKY